MTNIEKVSTIRRLDLSEEFYFQSLLEEALKHQMLSDSDIEKIKLGCLEFLAYKTNRYNGYDSCSICVEVAESIMKSNLYAISIALKAFDTPDDAVKALQSSKISDLYQAGKKRIETQMNSSKHIYALILKNKLNTINYTYNSTVVDGIKGFFKIYDPEYEAHEIHITADYPLFNQVSDLVGIEFIHKYLEAIYYENMFLQCFDSDDIHHLLCGYSKDYKDLVFNIFEQVLISSIGCTIIGEKSGSLLLSDKEIESLAIIFSDKSCEQIYLLIEKAFQTLFMQLNLTNDSLKAYVKNGLQRITANIYQAVNNDILHSVFIKPAYPEMDSKILMCFGDAMDNDQYRKLIDEIIQCRYSADKVSIIMHNVKSLRDLEDALIDAELNSDEILMIIRQLNIQELAALAKHHPHKSDIDAVDISESEQKLRLCIYNYVKAQPQDYRNKFDEILDCIEIE